MFHICSRTIHSGVGQNAVGEYIVSWWCADYEDFIGSVKDCIANADLDKPWDYYFSSVILALPYLYNFGWSVCSSVKRLGEKQILWTC